MTSVDLPFDMFAPAQGAPDARDIVAAARRVAGVAAAHAEATDRDGAFPNAAITALRDERLLSLLVPRDLGGAGARLGGVADACFAVGGACASTGLIFAMHGASLACLVRHGKGSEWHRQFLRRVAAEQLLLASSTTEGGSGGNVRSSDAALVSEGGLLRLSRAATVMSYGAQADAIVSTARRTVEAAASDQVLVVLPKADSRLAPTGEWDTFGMRGTCSGGFALEALIAPEQVLPVGYDKIHPATMVPVSHILWAAVWTGIAATAVGKAQLFVRTAARRSGGQMPPGATLVTRASATLRTLRSAVNAAIDTFERSEGDAAGLGSLETQTFFNLFKVEASEMAAEAVAMAMRACGLAGYRNDGAFGIGRHLRDVLSAPVMIHNERILANIGGTALLGGVPGALREPALAGEDGR